MNFGTPSRKSVMYKWLFSYVCVILILTVVSTLSYIGANKAVSGNALNENKMLLLNAKENFDNILLATQKTASKIAADKSIRDYAAKNKPITADEKYAAFVLSQEFGRYGAEPADDIYVYFAKSDAILNFGGMGEPADYHAAFRGGISYKDYMAVLRAEHAGSFFMFGDGAEGNNVSFIKTVPLLGGGAAGTVNIVITISEKKVADCFSVLKAVTGGAGYIRNRSTGLILNPDGGELVESADGGGDGSFFWERRGESIVAHMDSRVSDWRYISVIPRDKLFYNSNMLSIVIIINISTMLLLGVFITVILLRRNLKPVKKIVSALERDGKSFNNIGNEFEFIQSVISSTLSEKESIGRLLDRQSAALKNAFFQELINGGETEYSVIKGTAEELGIKFISSYFATAVFHVKNASDLFSEEKLCGEEQNRLLKIIMSNIIEELVSKYHLGRMVPVNDIMVCIVNVREDRLQNLTQDLRDCFCEAEENIYKYFGIKILTAFGEAKEGIDGLRESFAQAKQTMRYKILVGADGVTAYPELVNDGGELFYPVDYEHLLISSIKKGDDEAASSILKKIFRESFNGKRPSLGAVNELIFNLTATLFKAVNAVEGGSEKEFLRMIYSVVASTNSGDMDTAIAEKIEACVKELARRAKLTEIQKGADGKRLTGLSGRAAEYINESFSNSNLSAASVAEKLGVHSAYLSTVFKEHTGVGLLEFINGTRISEAKKLLRETELGMEYVSEAVGFASPRTFARVFKKREGIAPGEYRKAVQ